MTNPDSFTSRGTLEAGGKEYEIHRISTVEGHENLPYSLKVLLENLLRTCLLYTSDAADE